MEKQILLPIEKKRALAKVFGISLPTVYSALQFKREKGVTDPAKIRKAALEMGGAPVGFEPKRKKCVIAVETIHRTAERRMIQVFSPRVRVIVENITGGGTPIIGIEVDGKIKRKIEEDITIDEYTKLLEEVQKIAEQLTFNKN